MHLDHLPGTFFGPPNLVDLVRHRAKYQPNDTAFTYLVDGETEQVHITNAELDRQARAIGAWLQSLDLVGERALLLYPPGLEFVAAFFGCLYAGVVAVPVYPPRRNRSLSRIQAIADDAQAKVALTTDVVLQRVESLIDATPSLKQLTWLATCHAPEGMDEQWKRPDVHGDTLAFLQYTSGSTGTPKGVVLNHANLMHNSALIAHAYEHTRSGLGVFWLPSYHDMGLIGGILQPLYIGRPNILMSPMAFLQKPLRWLQAITRFGATTSGGPNFAYDLCVRTIPPDERAKLDLSSWRVAFNGAEPVREETLQRFTEAFEPCGFRPEAFYPCYGLAEATLLVSGGFAHDEPVVRWFDTGGLTRGQAIEMEQGGANARGLVGCGQTMPDQKIAIAEPEKLVSCEPGQIGEIWVNGPSVAQGYWQRPDVTETMFRAYLKDTGEGPFLRTGDLGFTLDGELFVTGRIKDLIIFRGVNYYPQDIERTVHLSHPDLRPDACAAFTVEVDGQERLVVVQELERRRQLSFPAVFAAVRRAVAMEHELALDAIVLLKAGSIPKTSSGKIQRHACRSGYLTGTLEVMAQWHIGDELPEEAERQAEEALAAKQQAMAAAQAERREAEAQEEAVVADEPVHHEPERNGEKTTPAMRFNADHIGHDHALAAPKNGNGVAGNGTGNGNGKKKSVADLVLEQVRRVARDRAVGLTLDTPITEIGLDSLERMEILASLEERFGGRFPPETLADLETCREVVEAVELYLGKEPRAIASHPVDATIPEEYYRLDRFPEYLKLRQNLDLLEVSGLGNPYFTVHQGITNDRTMIGGREYINFSSYNYVGMSGDPAVIQAAQDAAARYGTSVSASRLVSGQKDIHIALERALAKLVGTEDSIVLVGGHSTNESIIGHLVGPGDLILHDALSHNSIVQGAVLSGARRRPFPHNDWKTANELLSQFRHEYRRVLIVIEGVYSMDGDIPDLPKFIELKKRHKTLLMIDEAHSMGTIGAHGRGIGEYYAVNRNDVDLWMGTLSKSFGSCGGYIAGCKALVEYLRYTAPGFVYSVGLSPPNAAAALASVELLIKEPKRVTQLKGRSKLFLTLAKDHGMDTGMSKDSPVVPVIIGNSMHCVQLSQALFARGINVQPILYPAVEERATRLRFFITSLHTEAQIRYTVEALAEELEKIHVASAVIPS